MAAQTVALPNILPALPETPKQRGLALLRITEQIIDLRVALRAAQAEQQRLLDSLAK